MPRCLTNHFFVGAKDTLLHEVLTWSSLHMQPVQLQTETSLAPLAFTNYCPLLLVPRSMLHVRFCCDATSSSSPMSFVRT